MKKIIKCFIFSFVLVFISCTRMTDVQVDNFTVKVDDLKVNYDGTNVVLSWSKPSGNFDYYKIFRTNAVDSLGNVEIDSFTSNESRDSVGIDSLKFTDVIEPTEGTYFYSIRPIRISGGQRLQGYLSNVESCIVGNFIKFTIDDGATYVETDACLLKIYDLKKKLISVRFTQLSFNIDTITGAVISDSSKNEYPGDVDKQISDLIKSGFLVKSLSKIGSKYRTVPDFGKDDPRGNTTSFQLNIDNTTTIYPFRWLLSNGTGLKEVFAEVKYSNGRTDTLTTAIQTKKHKVEITFRNVPYGQQDATMRDTVEGNTSSQTKVKVFFDDKLHFSVKNFGDPTLDTAFDYWLMTDSSYYNMDRSVGFTNGGNTWLMTTPVRKSLTGIGDNHSSDFEYAFSVNSNDANSYFSNLKRVKNNGTGVIPFSGSSEQALQAFKFLPESKVIDFSRKQFYLVARFNERYFKDSYIYVFGFAGTTEIMRAYFNHYLPTIKRKTGDIDSVVVQPFSFALDSIISVLDNGYANIASVSLVIAKKPDTLNWVGKTRAPSYLTSELIQTYRNLRFEFPVEQLQTQLTKVKWDDIDPRSWPNGEYIMGVIVKDEYGREGFANIDFEGPVNLSNPWKVKFRANR